MSTTPGFFARELELHFRDEETNLLPGLAAAGTDALVRPTLEEHQLVRGLVARVAAGDAASLSRFGEAPPERGAVRVELAADIGDGVTDVVANVASLLTGEAQVGGFKGLGGRFDRHTLLACTSSHSYIVCPPLESP